MAVGPIEILTETDTERGWRFTSQSVLADGTLLPLTLELSWADYDFWCPEGTAPPSAVAEATIYFILLHHGDRVLPVRLDASHARRMHANADRDIRAALNPSDRS